MSHNAFKSGHSKHDLHLGSKKSISDLWVDGEKPWPSCCVWALVATKQIHHIINKMVVDQIIF
jgi:hypothetical protein